MEEKSNLEGIVGHVKDYVNTNVDIIKLKLIEKSSSVIASLVSGIILLVMFVFCTLLVSIGAAIWLNEKMDSSFIGFMIVAGVYLILGIALTAVKETALASPLSNLFVRQLLKDTKDHE